MATDYLNLKGSLVLLLTGQDGEVKDRQAIDNLIVQVGKNFVAAALVAASPTPFSYIAVGTGVTAPTLADTTLQTETGRVAMSSATSSTNVATMTSTFGAGIATGAVTEAGLFNASSVGVMLSHVTFSPVNKAAGDSLVVTWTVTAG